MKKVFLLFLLFFYLDAFAKIPYYYQEYPYYQQISVVDKSNFEMKTFKYYNNEFKEIFNKKIATGKNQGNKFKEGDEKTPEGIYFTKKFLSTKQLKKEYGALSNIYGTGAWTLNYPNVIDQKVYKKTGTGIWIHGTNDPKRIDEQFSSRGCVVLNNNDFNEFSQIHQKPHPVIINHATEHLNETEVAVVLKFLSKWKTDWEMETDSYFSHYISSSSHKKQMFITRDQIQVSMDNINIIKHRDYYQVNFIQYYKDSLLSDTGFKTLYISKENNKFQILEEQWIDLKVFDKTLKKQ